MISDLQASSSSAAMATHAEYKPYVASNESSSSDLGATSGIEISGLQNSAVVGKRSQNYETQQMLAAFMQQTNQIISYLFSLVNTLLQKLLEKNTTTAANPPVTTTPTNTPSTPNNTTPPTTTSTPSSTPPKDEPTTTTTTTTPTTKCECTNSTKPNKLNLAEPLRSNGFLWKPVAEKDGKLVVLLPSKLKGKIKSVKVTDAKGQVLASGKYSGVGNGDREHYRFDKDGSAFDKDVRVVMTLNDGSTRYVSIKEPSERYQR